MLHAMDDGEFTEVLVGGADHSRLAKGQPKDLCVTRITISIGHTHDIMPRGPKLACRAAPYAGVHQHLHPLGVSG